MKKLSAVELLKATAVYAGLSATVADAGLLLVDRTTALDFPGSWYINAPLAAWVVVGLPVSIKLAERMWEQARGKADSSITAGLEGEGANLRKIPFFANGRKGAVFANSAASPFADGPEPDGPTYHPAVWRVTLQGTTVTIRESELRAFLEVAWKRGKHQFSRRYWTEHRRPPMYRLKYDCLMTLLVKAGLVEGRHEDGRASGRLVVFPREAVSYLKYTSQFRAA
jgi:hypothetical protein